MDQSGISAGGKKTKGEKRKGVGYFCGIDGVGNLLIITCLLIELKPLILNLTKKIRERWMGEFMRDGWEGARWGWGVGGGGAVRGSSLVVAHPRCGLAHPYTILVYLLFLGKEKTYEAVVRHFLK